MDYYNPVSKYQGWRPEPRTPLQWHDKWTREMRIVVPTKHGHARAVELQNIAVPMSVKGDPDLLLTAKDGRQFYVQFRRGCVFRPLDKPLLIHPPGRSGVANAFWVLR